MRSLSITHLGLASRRAPDLLRGLLSTLEVRRSRRRLAALDDHLLRDVGLTRREALREAERPAWDAPRHWFR